MKRIVADSTIIIRLTKITLLEILSNDIDIIIPDGVYRETVIDAQEKFPDAIIAKSLVERKK